MSGKVQNRGNIAQSYQVQPETSGPVPDVPNPEANPITNMMDHAAQMLDGLARRVDRSNGGAGGAQPGPQLGQAQPAFEMRQTGGAGGALGGAQLGETQPALEQQQTGGALGGSGTAVGGAPNPSQELQEISQELQEMEQMQQEESQMGSADGGMGALSDGSTNSLPGEGINGDMPGTNPMMPDTGEMGAMQNLRTALDDAGTALEEHPEAAAGTNMVNSHLATSQSAAMGHVGGPAMTGQGAVGASSQRIASPRAPGGNAMPGQLADAMKKQPGPALATNISDHTLVEGKAKPPVSTGPNTVDTDMKNVKTAQNELKAAMAKLHTDTGSADAASTA